MDISVLLPALVLLKPQSSFPQSPKPSPLAPLPVSVSVREQNVRPLFER